VKVGLLLVVALGVVSSSGCCWKETVLDFSCCCCCCCSVWSVDCGIPEGKDTTIGLEVLDTGSTLMVTFWDDTCCFVSLLPEDEPDTGVTVTLLLSVVLDDLMLTSSSSFFVFLRVRFWVLVLDDWDNDCCDEDDVFLEEEDGALPRLLLRFLLLLLLLLRSFDLDLDLDFDFMLPLLSSMLPLLSSMLPLVLVVRLLDFFRFVLLLVVLRLLIPGFGGRSTSMITNVVSF